MVRSRLEYCCPVWNPVKISDIQKLENVQRCFVRKIAGLKDMDYWDRLKKLKMMSLQRRRERYCIIQVWKIINGHAPNDVRFNAVQDSLPAWDQGTNPKDQHQSPDICSK